MKIKICGITCVDDALMVARVGADAIGLNFFARSPRRVTPKQAAAIVRELPPFVEPVGLFVNARADDVRAVAGQVGLRSVQLHGDEPPELLAELDEFRLIRAFRLGAGMDGTSPLVAIADAIQACRRAGRVPDGVLVDAHEDGRYGGTGKTAPWSALAAGYDKRQWPPLLLAGGLTPDNVADGVMQVRPWAVDVASGVEGETPGRKSAERVEAFVTAARAAFAEILAESRLRRSGFA
jgi:phosphoribosylanthranilate isomerase